MSRSTRFERQVLRHSTGVRGGLLVDERLAEHEKDARAHVLSRTLTVQEVIAALHAFPPEMRVVAEYDGSLYPVLSAQAATVEGYPREDLVKGEAVCQIVYAEYR